MFNVLLTLFLAVAAFYGIELWSSGHFPLQSYIASLLADTSATVVFGAFVGINLLLWSALKKA